MLVVLIVLLVAVKAGCAADSDQPLYACPHQSWCVPAKYCPADKVSFHSTTTRNYSAVPSDHFKFMCGVTVDTDGDLCCRELAALPKPFVPTLTRWHFLDKNSSVERLPMQVIAWPGYGTEPAKPELGTDPHTGAPQVPFRGQLRTTSICPPMSVCVPAYDCPSKSIYYTVDVPSPARGKFLCGVTLGSEGWLCCSLHVIKDAMGEWRRPARHPVPDDHEVLIRISFDSQKLQQRTGADVAQYSRTPHAAAPPSPPLPATRLPDYYEDNHINDVNHALLQGRKLLDAPRRRYRRDAAEAEASLKNAESSNETYVIHGAADRGNATLYTVTQATLISDVPPTARSRLPVEEERCGEPLVPHAPHGAAGVPLHAPLEGQYPWHVAVLTSSGEYLCGGVLVTERHVLTVAHCISPRLPSQVVIRVGDFNLLSDSETHPSYDVPVSRITCHPEYSRTTLRSDVCVVQLRVAVLWLPNVRRICLPGETSHPDPTVECFVPSWGYVAKGQDGKIYDSFAPQLRHLPFLAIDGARCQRELRKVKKLGSFFKINSGVLCSKGRWWQRTGVQGWLGQPARAVRTDGFGVVGHGLR
ncbi:uncharacterized protein LOC126983643 isoform X6 [Eriocheir sinensis]|uniref:uncharacterized protein LOC126983643 isoform X6 n=1 Tax=Eriocheir sinensis TaxID=95602 RepID=UPI0021C77DA3|nr:uncharacterized protein LOC126983643 isoform X6 [Eriocheir sinensis]